MSVAGSETLHEVADECRARCAVEEDDLLQEEAPAEDHLVDLAGPRRVGLVAELRVEAEIATLLREARRRVQARSGKALGPGTEVEVMQLVGRHEVVDGTERLELTRERVVQLNRRPDPQAPVRETHHRHAGGIGKGAQEAHDRTFSQPQVLAVGSEHCAPRG